MVNLDSKTNTFLTRHWLGVAVLAIFCSVIAAYIYGWLQAPASLISSLPSWVDVGRMTSTAISATTNTGSATTNLAGGSVTNTGSGGSITNPLSPTPSKQGPKSFDEYVKRIQSLSDRFLEKQEYIEQNNGALIEWDGVVVSVSQHQKSKLVWIQFEGIGQGSFLAALPDSHRTKAYSLQKGDVVRIKGTLDLTVPNAPYINASELTLKAPRGKK